MENVSEAGKLWALKAIRFESGLFGMTCGCTDMKEAVRTGNRAPNEVLDEDTQVREG
ncbi:hypothetical protein BDU57DRAFT_515605 [Ampelomyces quisqualis]|uniref:Uncharacterized protein n=1 Tax=Ampelomyces quisqualis TaxID=50730 RepID=A0A6A5QKD1_AMPQU|nr:hypothetical protein BDU57DRAFT_515605 [Ampelomyces quisqualis]